ncbi:MAG: OmpA family protein [Paludibacteraceae bacterium]|nr:OmpA family protein [Paludibacteraceae bacterium]
MKRFFCYIFVLSFAICVNAQTSNCYLTPMSNINTADNEYNSILCPSGDVMAYTKSTALKHGDYNELVYSAKFENKEWVPDGKILSLRKSYSHIDVVGWPSKDTVYAYKGTAHGKILIYGFNGTKWKKCGKIKICNTRIKKSCTNTSGTSIYFSTERRKGLGKQDLYVTHLDNDGNWSKPINLGDKINTKKNEIAPTLVGDSILFFASDRDGGLGGYDIYYSKMNNGEWSEPINAGEPINSAKDDAFYFKCQRERDAIISSNRDGGMGGMDLYLVSYILDKTLTVDFPKPATMLSDKLLADLNLEEATHLDSTKITLVKGIVMGDDSIVLKAKIALSDNNLRQVIATQDAETNGAYQVILPGGSNYGIAVSHPGYMFHSENFDLPEQNEYKEISKDITLKKIAVGKSVILKNLFYEIDKADLSLESIVELGNVIKLLNDNPTMCLEIQGHTDRTGTKAHNKTLSEKRAQSVATYLIEKGIDPNRLTSKGYGYDKPIAPNNTEEGRAENRRTEIVVTKI